VALPVLLLSGTGILAFLLLSPLRSRPEEKWARWFTTNFPRALAPLAVLLLISVNIRTREYGITEPRYLGIVAAVWIFAWALVFILRRNAGIRWIPSSLAVIAMSCAFGPWSAGDVSKTSQLKRLKQILQANSLWKDEHAMRSNTEVGLSSKDSTDLDATISYLVGRHGGASIRNIFESVLTIPDWSKLDTWDAAREIGKSLGLKTYASFLYAPNYEHLQLETIKRREASVGVAGFRQAWRTQVYTGGSVRFGDITIFLKDGALLFSMPQEEKPKDIPVRQVLDHSSVGPGEKELSTESLTLDLPQAQPIFRLIFDRIIFRRDVANVRITGAEFYILEK